MVHVFLKGCQVYPINRKPKDFKVEGEKIKDF